MRSTICILLLLTLTACNSLQRREPTMDNPGDGAVVVRVLSNTNVGGMLNPNQPWSSLEVEGEATGSDGKGPKYYMTATLGASSRSVVFAASLPPGRYHVTTLYSQMMHLTVNKELDTFPVEAGRLTDLGVLVETPSPAGGRQFTLSHTNVKPEETATLVSELLPGLRKLLERPVQGWGSPSLLMSSASSYAFAHSFGMISPQQTEDGLLLFGGVDGAVRSWSEQRGWALYDVGQRSAVEALLVALNGDWIAGGELGLLVVSSDRGSTWHSIRGNLPYGTTLGLFNWRGQLLAMTQRDDDIYIHLAQFGAGNWKQLAKYRLTQLQQSAGPKVRPSAELMGDKLAVALPYSRLAVLELDTGASAENDFPGKVFGFSVLPDGSMRCRCMDFAMNPYESRDMGKTWEYAPGSRWLQMPAFRDNTHGVAYEGAMMSKPSFDYTADGGRNWVIAQEAPPGLASVFWSRDGKTAYAFSQYGEMWLSRDDGHSWSSDAH